MKLPLHNIGPRIFDANNDELLVVTKSSPRLRSRTEENAARVADIVNAAALAVETAEPGNGCAVISLGAFEAMRSAINSGPVDHVGGDGGNLVAMTASEHKEKHRR